jgi:S1-C subfamily serine protease
MKRRIFHIGALALMATISACAIPALVPPTETGPAQLVLAPTLPAVPTATGLGTPLLPQEADLVALYEAVNQGVVMIKTYASSAAAQGGNDRLGEGSGFVIDMLGHIVTNQHVIQDAEQIEVDFPTGMKAWASVVGTDPHSDLAVLKVDVDETYLHPLALGDSDLVQVGEIVAVIGNPFGLTGSMTVGVVSALGRTLASEAEAPGGGTFSAGDLIQTDAAINPGNSGGPLLNMRGEVIGVSRAIRTESFTIAGDAASSGVGFAIPVNIVRRVAPALIETGKFEYPWLGISSLNQDVFDLRTLEMLGLPPTSVGAYITCVQSGGPAQKAGLRGASYCGDMQLKPGGDLIIAINDVPVRTFNDLISYLVNYTSVGQTVRVTVLREGEQIEFEVLLEPRP